MAFESIGTAADRAIYSATQAMIEHGEAVKRAENVTNAAIRLEHKLKRDAEKMRQPAIKGSLHALAAFIALADKYDEAVINRRGAEKTEDRIRTYGVSVDEFCEAGS